MGKVSGVPYTVAEEENIKLESEKGKGSEFVIELP